MPRRIWFITGVSRGIGRSIADAAVEAGDTVIGTVRSGGSGSALDPGTDPDETGRMHTLTLDLRDGHAIPPVVDQAFSLYGRLDVIVNNAAFPLFGALEEATDEQVRRVFDVNVHGPRRLIQAALPRLRAQGSGRILDIGSVSAYSPLSGYGYYATTKAAMEAFNEVLAEELAPFGIKVTSVSPGAFRTGFITAKSVQSAATTISGYDITRRNIEAFYDASGKQPGDPARLAQVLLALVESPNPPRRLLLGSDALARAHTHTDRLLAEMAANESITTSTDFPDEPTQR